MNGIIALAVAASLIATTGQNHNLLFTTAITALASCVSFLWHQVSAGHKDTVERLEEMHQATIVRLDDCEEDRELLWAQVAKVSGSTVETLKKSKVEQVEGE